LLKKLVVAFAVVGGLLAAVSSAAVISMSDSQLQSGYSGYVPGDLYSFVRYDPPVTGPIDTDDCPAMTGFCQPGSGYFNFGASPDFGRIDQLSITMTVMASGMREGGFDYDDWTLHLDGIETGLRLRGFPNLLEYWLAGMPATFTFTGTVGPNVGLALAAALRADGLLMATIHDRDLLPDWCPAQWCQGTAEYNYVHIPQFDGIWSGNPLYATLMITGLTVDDPALSGVPEPSTLGLLGLGLMGVAVYARRRKA
jgi:PEP-CTERM motif